MRFRFVAPLILLLAAVLLARTPRALGPVSNALTPLLAPLHAATTTVTAWFHGVGLVRGAGRVQDLETMIAAGDAERAALRVTVARLQEAASEAERAAATAIQHSGVLTRVIAQTNAAGMHRLTVSVPSADIPIGAPVLARGSFIGTVADIGSSRAFIRLLTDSGMRVAARASTAPEPLGVVEPGIGGGLLLTHIPIDAAVTSQTTIVTAPLDARVPDGLPIGTITDIRVDADGFFQTASVAPFIDPHRVTIVSILAP